MPQGSFGAFTDEDFLKPRRRGKWLKASLFTVLALGVIGGGLYGGYQWTQTQYFVGAKDDHVALYRGISQDLAWIKLNAVDEDHPEIELKYLPVYQRNQVKETIAVDNRNQASEKVVELGKQAGACQAKEQREAAERAAGAAKGKGGQAGKPGGTPTTGAKPGTAGNGVAGTLSATAGTTPTPTPSQTPSEEQQKLEKNCSTQQ
ncbi:hypothetical protein O1M07_22285 [Streptomyces albulus]|nr:hypothetical protein [Streptomyces noursei]MCZ1016858.1 hypothetical protein [Streptomyces noursei]